MADQSAIFLLSTTQSAGDNQPNVAEFPDYAQTIINKCHTFFCLAIDVGRCWQICLDRFSMFICLFSNGFFHNIYHKFCLDKHFSRLMKVCFVSLASSESAISFRTL
jgi:hypothetical protein